MKINIIAKPQAKKNQVTKIDEVNYRVAVTAPAHNNLANQAIVELLAEYFGAKKSEIILCQGQKERQKVFIVPDQK